MKKIQPSELLISTSSGEMIAVEDRSELDSILEDDGGAKIYTVDKVAMMMHQFEDNEVYIKKLENENRALVDQITEMTRRYENYGRRANEDLEVTVTDG